VKFAFGLEAWETDHNFCKNIVSEFILFLKENNTDWLLSTDPRFEECLPNHEFQLIPTGEKSKILHDELLSAGARMVIGTVLFEENNYMIKSIDDLTLVKVTSNKLSDDLKVNREIYLKDLIL
jgi:hypothetical protein